MNTRDASAAFDSYFVDNPVMVILRGFDSEQAIELTRRAWRLGLFLVEIPIQSDRDRAVLAAAAELGRGEGQPVGAGTVTSVELVARAADAGATFTVAPGLDDRVAIASIEGGLPHLPGVATASEIHRALQLGMRWQKAFPAAQLGSDWIAAMRGPFPDVRLVATGGIDTDNAQEFLRAGAAACRSAARSPPPPTRTSGNWCGSGARDARSAATPCWTGPHPRQRRTRQAHRRPRTRD